MFTLDQARGFVAVAEELHFGRAAARLSMTQPPLSRQIQKLERSIGVELLQRDNRKVELTAAGKVFLEEARRLVIAAEHAPRVARKIADGLAGELRIGFTAASTFGLLGPLLGQIAERLPDVDLVLNEMVTRRQVAAIIDGELDLGLARPPFDPVLDSQLLLAESLVLAVPSGHPLVSLRRDVRADDLVDVSVIMHSPIHARYFYDLIVRHIDIDHGNVVHTVSQILTMVSLAAAGRGVAFVPESAQLLGIGGVCYLRLADVRPDAVELHAIWNRNSANPALARLIDVVRSRWSNLGE